MVFSFFVCIFKPSKLFTINYSLFIEKCLSTKNAEKLKFAIIAIPFSVWKLIFARTVGKRTMI